MTCIYKIPTLSYCTNHCQCLLTMTQVQRVGSYLEKHGADEQYIHRRYVDEPRKCFILKDVTLNIPTGCFSVTVYPRTQVRHKQLQCKGEVV